MRPTKRHQQGATLIEASLTLIAVIFAVGLALEVSHTSQVRHMATLALYQTSRMASVTQAHPTTMHTAFSQAIAPLFIARTSRMQDFTQIATHVLPARHPSDTGKQLPRWQLEVLSPTRESFKDFADPALSHLQRHPVIRNDYLAEQHQKYLALGWPSGRGPHSGQTIFQANTLVLRLTFMYPPAVPGVRLLVKVLGTLGAKREDLVGQAWRQGLMATVLETESMMQSNLIAWDRQAGMAPPGTVTRKQVWERPLDAPQPLISLQRPLPFNSQKIRLQGRVPATVDPTPVRPTRAETTGQPTPVQAKKNEPTESELCGVLLCCIERD